MKKIYKIILLSLGTIVFLLMIGTNLILKGVVTSYLESSLNRRVTISSLWLNPFTGTLFSRNVTIWNGEEQPLLSLKSIEINTDPLKLFRRKLSISEVRLIEPALNLISLEDNSKDNTETSPKIKESASTASSQGFLREVEVHNIAIENLTFIRPDGILKSMNTITLKVPESTYENNDLDLSANLNILGSGLVDIKIKVNTKTGLLNTSLVSQGFHLNNTFSSKEKGDLSLSGNIKGNIFIQGNYLKKIFQAGGNIIGSNILVEDEKGEQVLNSEHIFVDLESLTIPEISLNLKKVEIKNTQSSLSIFQKEKKGSTPEKKQEISPKSAGMKSPLLKDIRIDEFIIKRSSLSYRDLIFTDIDLDLKDLRNVPQNKSSAALSFTLNNTINFSSQSLVEVLDYSMGFDPLKSLIFKGNFTLDTPSLALPDSIQKNLPYEAEIKNVNLKGNYSYNYPNITLKSDIFTEDLKLIGKKTQLHNILLKSLSGKVSSAYNLDDNSYSLSGPLDLKILNIKDKKGQNFFNGDLAVAVSSLNKKKIILDSVKFSSFFLDLNTKISPEDSKSSPAEEATSQGDKSLSKEEEIEVVIDSLKLRKGRIVTGDLSFENVYLNGNNISNKKINSNFVVDILINSSASLKGDLNIKLDDIDMLSDLKAKGNISISNLDLKILTPYIEMLPYKLNGIINYSSFLDYSKDSMSSKGSFSASDLYIKKSDSMEMFIENIRSKMDFRLKKEEVTLLKSNFSFLNLNGKIKDETKFKISKGDIGVKELSPKTIKFGSISLTSPMIDLREPPKESGDIKVSSKIPDEQKEKKPLPVISASKIKIKNGKVTYRGLKKTSVYDNIGISAVNFTTEKNKRFSIDAGFSIIGIEKIQLNGNLTLKEDWDFSPKTLTFSGVFNVTKLKIPDFNNYLRKSLPNEFDGGLLSSKGKVNVKAGQLDSEHDITISKVVLGKSTGYSKEIPLGSIIKVLIDKYGNINLTLPITGDLTNPKLGITTIVSSSLMSGLVKAARSPQTIISKILPLENNEIKTIYFQYLSNELSKLERDKLSEIVNILTENPNSKVTFTLYTNNNIEKNLIATKSITGILSGQRIGSKMTLEDLMEERKQYILNFFTNRVSSKRIEIKISKDSRSLPQAKVDFKE
ncbi:DUF748 domain-containing protein [Fusobacteria bacterium ZRK30]|nr:DUF748 domain-containing protein [Fusobacteria bacterium ZRK30]